MQSVPLRVMRILGALTVLAVGAVHLEQYAGSGYHAVPTIGPLFLLNGIASGLIGVALLLAPVAASALRRALSGDVAAPSAWPRAALRQSRGASPALQRR